MFHVLAGGNVLCLDLWGRQGGGASLQALHFSYALGAFIAPVIIHPFFAGQHLPVVNSNISDSAVGLSSVSPLPVSHPVAARLLAPHFMDDSEQLSMSLQDAEDAIDAADGEEDIRNAYEDEDLIRVPRLGSSLAKRSARLPKSLATTTPKFDLMSLDDEDLLQLTKPVKSSETGVSESSMISTVRVSTAPPLTSTLAVGYDPTTDIPLSANTPASAPNSTKPVRPKPSHTGASVKNEDSSKWKKPIAGAAVTENTAIPNSQLSMESNVSNSTLSKHNNTTALSTPLPSIESSSLPAVTATVPIAVNESPATPLPSRVRLTSPSTTAPDKYDAVDALYKKRVSALNEATSEEEHHSSSVDDSVETSPTGHSDMMAEEPSSTIYANDQLSVAMQGPEVQDLKEPLSLPDNLASAPSLSKDHSKFSNVSNSKSNKFIHTIVRFLKKPGTYSNVTDDNKFIETIAQKFKRYGVTKIHLAFICIGVFVFINSLIFVVMLCHNPREPRSKQEEGTLDRASPSRYKLFMVLFSLFMFTAEALEGAIHHLLAANSEGNGIGILDKGIDGPALFWGLVCIVRFLCILLSGCVRLKPGKILGISIFITTIGTIFLCIGSFGKTDFLWSGVVLAALGLAPTLPTSLLWMAQYMHVTHKMCAIMIILTSLGNSVTHGGLAHIAANSHLYSYLLVAMSLTSLLLLVVSWCLLYFSDTSSPATGTSTRRGSAGLSTDPSTDGYRLARQHEDDDDDIDVVHDRMEMSRQSARHSLTGQYQEDLRGAADRNQHRQLHHMHHLEHEEAGQSLLID